ncbi:hypothetical protein [Falsiphaeobacter marinintestinus]|uniref:hypothetical protein n=1 Tax=Falsiphaeobacter marinintestinus TaxID=1492905 RepID=UPI0011B540B0|nr:hypothetical protein [Phaeobacter marinintestinus]
MKKTLVACCVLASLAGTAGAETLLVGTAEPLTISVSAPPSMSLSVSWYSDLAEAQEVQVALVACGYEDVSLETERTDDGMLSFVGVTFRMDDPCVDDALN